MNKTIRETINIVEASTIPAKLETTPLPYSPKDLEPVMSAATIEYHYEHLAKAYAKKYNAGEGDPKFNRAGSFLHNKFFPQLKAPKGANRLSTSGTIKTIPNHQVRTDICVLVDWWEHAWALDYEWDKEKYLDNIWKIINWNVCSERL